LGKAGQEQVTLFGGFQLEQEFVARTSIADCRNPQPLCQKLPLSCSSNDEGENITFSLAPPFAAASSFQSLPAISA